MFDNLFGTPSSQWDLTGGVFGTFYSLEGVERAAGPRGQSYVAYFRNIGFRTMLHRGCTDYANLPTSPTPASFSLIQAEDPEAMQESQPFALHSCPDVPHSLFSSSPSTPTVPPPDYGVPGYDPHADTHLTPGF